MSLSNPMAEDQTKARHEAVEQIKQLMAAHGLTMGDLFDPVEPEQGLRGRIPSLAEARAPILSRGTVKYRDPVSGSVWNGHGLVPVWLRAALDAKRSLDEFLV
jgi:DNA-binding protein H-NS